MSPEICKDATDLQDMKYTIKLCNEKSDQITCMQKDSLSANIKIICLLFIPYHCNLSNRLMHIFHSPSIIFLISSLWTIWICSSLMSAGQIRILYGCKYFYNQAGALKQWSDILENRGTP